MKLCEDRGRCGVCGDLDPAPVIVVEAEMGTVPALANHPSLVLPPPLPGQPLRYPHMLPW